MSCSIQDFSYFCPRQQRKVFFDYYALLNIKKCATEDEIKKAYRNLAKVYHPDRCIQDQKEISKEKFKIIGDAYQNLIDPERRVFYNSVLKQIELKQNAKMLNPQGMCSVLQSCSREELVYVLLGSFCKQDYSSTQSPQQPESKQSEYYQQKQKECLNKSYNNNSSNNNMNKNIFFSNLNQNINNSSMYKSTNDMNNNAMNNNFECNAQNGGFSDSENGSDESENEPQCQGYDASSFSSNQSEQSFYSKFSFFNYNNNKETLNPENFTFLKGLFSNKGDNYNKTYQEDCDDEITLRYKKFQEESRLKNAQAFTSSQSQQKGFSDAYCTQELNEKKENYNCITQQNLSTNFASQQQNIFRQDQNHHNVNQKNTPNCRENQIITEEDNLDDAEEAEQFIDEENQNNNTSKNRLTKAHIQMVQRLNQSKKIIERIRNKKQVFSTILCKRIKKQH